MRTKVTTLAISMSVAFTAVSVAAPSYAPEPVKANGYETPEAPPPGIAGGGLSKKNPPPSTNASNASGVAAAPQQQIITVYRDQLPQGITPPLPILREITDNAVAEDAATVLTNDQIQQVKRTYQRARKEQLNPYPDGQIAKPINRPIQIDPDNIKSPPMLRLTLGALTQLSFMDRDGNPWPIKKVRYNKAYFSSPDFEERGSNSSDAQTEFSLEPMEPYAYGNMVVTLLGKNGNPITFTFMLSAGHSNVFDNQVDVRINGKNPAAMKTITSMQTMPTFNIDLENFLYYQIPDGAKRLNSNNSAVLAWSFGSATIIRTRLTLFHPAFIGHVGSSDGIHVYQLAGSNQASLLFGTDDGKQASVQLTN
jgi:intracellular multiplication protein IcmK